MNKKTSKDQQIAQPANSTHEVAEDDLTQGLTFPESKGTKPTKLTKKTLSRLLKAISNGTPISSACVIAGIANSTLNEWRQEHPEINERIELARERMREKLLARIELAAVEDWRAAAELLKLSFASDYRRVQSEQKHLHVHGDTHVTLSIEQQAALREQWRRIIATSVDAQRTLAGTSATGDQEQAQSYRVKRKSLLVEAQPEQSAEQQPEQPAGEQQQQPEPEEESSWTGPWHKAADAPKEYNEAADAEEAWARLRLR